MERYEFRRVLQSTVSARAGLNADLRLAYSGFTLATLVLVLLAVPTGEGFAQTGAAIESERGDDPIYLAFNTPPPSMAKTSVWTSPPARIEPKARRVGELDALLAVRSASAPITARQTDEAIAAAADRGLAKDLEKPNPFRKKSNDLFRTQHSLQLGNQEMQVRLRVRAKARNAMSVELRF